MLQPPEEDKQGAARKRGGRGKGRRATKQGERTRTPKCAPVVEARPEHASHLAGTRLEQDDEESQILKLSRPPAASSAAPPKLARFQGSIDLD